MAIEPVGPRNEPNTRYRHMQISVKTLERTRLNFAVTSGDTIEYVKLLVHIDTGIPPMEQRLIGRLKQHERGTLESNGIIDGTSLELLLRLWGGVGGQRASPFGGGPQRASPFGSGYASSSPFGGRSVGTPIIEPR